MRLLFTFLFFLFLLNAYSQCDTSRYTKAIFSSVTKFADVQYGQGQVWNIPYNNTDLFMDIYVPTGDTLTKRPLLLLAHPGGFLLGDKEANDMVALCDSFARKGWVTASMSYRLGFNPLSASSAVRAVYRGTQDMRAAIRFLKEFAPIYGIDTNYTFLGGSSAGAFAALHTAYLNDAEAPSDIAGGIGYPGLGCLDCSGNTYQHNMDITGIFSLWGALGDSNYIQANETVPALLIHGEADGTVPIGTGHPFGVFTTPITNGSRPISNQLTSLGIAHSFMPFAGLDHEFHGADNGTFNTPPNNYWDTIVDAIQNHFYPLLVPSPPVILGNGFVCLGDTFVYHFQGAGNEFFCSDVVNGTIVNDWSDSIQVVWNSIGMGNILVYAYNSIQAVSVKSIFPIVTADLPDATFTFVATNLNVDFTANYNAPNVSYSWQFNTINTGIGFNPSFDFLNPGTYSVTLTVIDFNSCSNSSTQTFTLSTNSLNDIDFENVAIFPNPMEDVLNITAPLASQIQLLDELGREMVFFITESHNTTISTSGLFSGIYFLKVDSDGIMRTFKVIKSHDF